MKYIVYILLFPIAGFGQVFLQDSNGNFLQDGNGNFLMFSSSKYKNDHYCSFESTENNRIDLTNDIILSGEFTLSFWFKSTTFGGADSGVIFARGASVSPYNHVYLFPSSLSIRINSSRPVHVYNDSGSWISDTWYHVVITRNAGAIKMSANSLSLISFLPGTVGDVFKLYSPRKIILIC